MFAPGDRVANRYRIVTFLGRGGMGSVYRADDLKLGQAVALKFLSAEATKDPERLARLYQEVRLAREVTHPNVCRVHDVGEVAGRHFISMEYVQGEDLESLLHRIGRLPQGKAVDVARQLCAGLAAAHAKGILHRDLKPANVMLDERGAVRILDFGLAVSAEEGHTPGEIAGTLTYMSPEQLTGKPASPRSDIFALGLVLYELFTGEPAFAGRSVAELQRLYRESAPRAPSSKVDGIDPAVEAAILRCLERAPEDRPGSVAAVAAALPGGDPLAAALAAGETPSPQMVANAGGSEGLRPGIGLLLLAIVVIGLATFPWQYRQRQIAGQVRLEKPPEALAVTAREVIEQAGYLEPPADRVSGFGYDMDYVDRLRSRNGPPPPNEEPAVVRPAPIFFWYRQSPEFLVASLPFGDMSEAVNAEFPAWDVPGMVGVWLDPEGRLLRFKAVPPAVSVVKKDTVEPDWEPFFEAARLDLHALAPVQPQRNPLLDCDVQWAWEGSFPGQPGILIRVEAGAHGGRAAYFEVLAPWRVHRLTSHRAARRDPENLFFFGFFVVVIIGGALLARRNIRLGRWDRRGAARLTLFFFILVALGWVLGAHHVPTLEEFALLFNLLGWALLGSALVWIVYVALEPYARRLWPAGMITWSRLLAGRFRDPMVGRDILIGISAFMLAKIAWCLYWILVGSLSPPGEKPVLGVLSSLNGVRHALAWDIRFVPNAILMSIGWLFVVLVLRRLLRSQWLAVGLLVTASCVVSFGQSWHPLLFSAFLAITLGWFFFVLLRFGLLAGVCWFLPLHMSMDMVLTSDLSSWFAGRSLFSLLLLAALAAYGFFTSLAGRPLLGDDFQD